MQFSEESELICEIKSSKVMHWNYRKYKSLPVDLHTHGEHVTDLYLKLNDLACLPPWIGCLKNLRELYLRGNRLTVLPEEIGNLFNLRVLHVDQNKLTELPELLGQLKNLNDINLEGNCLEIFPAALRHLKAVYAVNLRSNRISVIPEWLDEMVSLQELIMDYNFLTNLPLNIVYLRNLTYLSVASNEMLYLPFLPFFNEISLGFWGNPTLNYIWRCYLLNQSNFAVCFGSPKNVRVKTPEPSTTQKKEAGLRLYIPEVGETIILPFQIQRVVTNSERLEAPSLFELSLRAAYELVYVNQESSGRRYSRLDVSNDLPIQLQRRLKLGPVAHCANCRDALFSEASIVLNANDSRVSGLNDVDATYIAAEFYCLSKCSRPKDGSLEWRIGES